MSGKVTAPRLNAKKRHFPQGNQICPAGNQISPVMQKVRGSLSAVKAAQELAFLTGQPLSICQKLLSGHRSENGAMLTALFRSRLIAATIVGLTEGCSDPDVKAMRQAARTLLLEQRHRRERDELEAGE